MIQTPSATGRITVPAQAVAGTGTFVRVMLLKLDPEQHFDRSVLTLSIGANPLTGLKLTRSAVPDGIHVDVAVDADLNSPNVDVQSCYPADAHTAAATSNVQICLNNSGAAEWAMWAKASSATTVSVQGVAV